MYLTVAVSAVSGANVMDVVRTLVVRHSRYDERQEELPHIETGEDRGKEAAGVELLDDVRNFCIRRGRDKTRVDRHVEGMRIAPRCVVYGGRREGRGGEDVGKPRGVNRRRIIFPREDEAEKRISDCLIAGLGASGGHCKRSHVNHINFRNLVRYRPGVARRFGFSASGRATTGLAWMMLSYTGRHCWSADTVIRAMHVDGKRCRKLSLSRDLC